MKKLITLLILLSFTLHSMEVAQESPTKRNKDTLERTTLADILKTDILSLKTIVALTIGNNYFDTKENPELLELPIVLVPFILICTEIGRQTKLNKKQLKFALQLIDENNRTDGGEISLSYKEIRQIFDSSLRTRSPQLARLMLVQFQKLQTNIQQIDPLVTEGNTKDNNNLIPYRKHLQLIILIIDAVCFENLIDMGFENESTSHEFENTLNNINGFIKENDIQLKNIRPSNCFKLNIQPIVLVARLMLKSNFLIRKFRTLSCLLDQGAYVNHLDKKGASSLMVNSSPDCVRFLLSKGADPNIFILGIKNNGALHSCLREKNFETAQILLDNGFNIKSDQIEVIIILLIQGFLVKHTLWMIILKLLNFY